MHADIHKRAKVDHITNNAGKHHADGKVGNIENIGMKLGHGQIISDIAPGLFKFIQNINNGRFTDRKLCAELIHAVKVSRFAKPLESVNGDILFGVAELAEKKRRFFIGFGVDACIIKDFIRMNRLLIKPKDKVDYVQRQMLDKLCFDKKIVTPIELRAAFTEITKNL